MLRWLAPCWPSYMARMNTERARKMRLKVKYCDFSVSGGVMTLDVNEEDLKEALSSKLNKIRNWF